MESVQTITIADRPAFLSGAPGDPFWQAQNGFDSRHFPLARFIGRCLPGNAITFDIGANIGLVTLLLAMHCPAGQVFAVEPVAQNVRYLRRNLEPNGIQNCTVIEAAVGRTEDEVRVHPQGAYSYVIRDPRASGADARVSLLHDVPPLEAMTSSRSAWWRPP